MRIDSIAITNLASLRGRQTTIDLREGPLAEADLIAVTGPTGAGKTTLFDAVCLALFDQTPRTRGRGRDPRDLLSRGAAEAAVAVALTLDDGRRWQAEWSVHRAHGQNEGQLQATRQRVVDRSTGATLAEGKKAVKDLIENALGLSFEQFTSVVLIAQGEFARFLEASDADRSSLLEKLTGTEIYSELSRAAFEENRRLQDQLAEGEKNLSGVEVLDATQRHELEHELERLRSNQQTLVEALEATRDYLRWHREKDELEERQRGAQTELERELATEDEWKTEQQRLEAAERAAAVLPTGQAVAAARRRVAEAQVALDATRQSWDHARVGAATAKSELASRLQQLEQALREAELRGERTQGAAALAGGVLDQLTRDHALVESTAHQLARLTQSCQEARAEAAAATEAERRAHELAARAREVRERDEAAAAELRATWQDLEAGTDRHGWQLRRLHFQQALDLADTIRRLDLARLEQGYKNARAQFRQTEEALIARRQAADEAKTDLRVHEALLQRAFQARELAQHRHLLVAGENCPLCGSLDHPWAHRATDEERALHEQAEARRQTLEEKVHLAELAARQAEDANANARAQFQSAEATRLQAQKQRANTLARWEELRFELTELPAAPDLFVFDGLPAIDQRLEQFDALAPRLEAAETRLAAARQGENATAQAAAVAAERSKLAQARVDQENEAVELQETLLRQQRHQRDTHLETLVRAAGRPWSTSGGPLADSAAAALLATLAADLRSWEESQEQITLLQQLRHRFEKRLADLGPLGTALPLPPIRPEALADELESCWRQAERALREELLALERKTLAAKDLESDRGAKDEAEAAVHAALRQAQFPDENSWQAALLQADALRALRSAVDERRQRRERARAQVEAATQILATHHTHAPTAPAELPPTLAELEALMLARENERRLGDERVITLQVSLAQDQARRERVTQLGADLATLRQRAERAARLNALIGQKDGGKFRRFAQQLNLEQLLGLANLRLDRLAPRYQLVAGEALDIEVLDREMADERRPVSTLSGGESFLVSLALALGLADLRRGKLALGTLFLDEGFGSLDEDTLDTALAVLEQLQADQNTQILIISHVGALRERIEHRIEVAKLGGGRSRLLVPT